MASTFSVGSEVCFSISLACSLLISSVFPFIKISCNFTSFVFRVYFHKDELEQP